VEQVVTSTKSGDSALVRLSCIDDDNQGQPLEVLWDLDTGEQSSELNGQPIDAVDVAFTPDGTALVSTTRRGVITLWNSVTGQAIGPRFDHHKEAVWRVAVTPSGAVVSAGEDGLLARLDALDLGHACDLGAPSLDRRARDRYLGDREPIGCTE
jgi:WD40 repeat protein